ncbi:Por secretion system C-terminal sorting domain-containing protein [Pustulibacterium marinum]|uniref:Por secretion system C-terminal sorting domain-containing protein n=1 Tax=Pustulibacterium marinum TaxID=1224947 RepID=A0A1I7HIM5_9FLAO|nr:T9SS type A sorting domain-containing protein [Pustulibacterium marinum]SFU60600.1 Por secretion system C-terminal sorting domain-containing protein [Pustulibacterium marinum]
MKKKLLLLGMLMSIFFANAQCETSSFITTNYIKDAKILALREILSDPNDVDYDNPEIPQSRYQPYLEDLSVIYSNVQSIADVDSVFVQFQIHANPAYTNITPYNNFKFSVSADTEWLTNYKNTGVSGVAELDALMNTYDFTIDNYQDFSTCSCTWFSLKTDDVINMTALENDFLNIEGIENAEGYISFDEAFNYDGVLYSISGPWNEDNYVEVADIIYNTDTETYQFFLYAGDCLSGCQQSKSWDIQMNDNCTFNFLANDDFAYATIECYPNPVKDVLHISSDKPIENVRIYNLNGALLKESKSFGAIDVSQLASGVYFVQLTGETGSTLTKKFIKY